MTDEECEPCLEETDGTNEIDNKDRNECKVSDELNDSKDRVLSKDEKNDKQNSNNSNDEKDEVSQIRDFGNVNEK